MSRPERESDKVEITLDAKIYGPTAVKKTAYRLASRCTIVLGELAGDQLRVIFKFRPGTSDATAEEVVRLFYQELLDEELRGQLRDETDSLRSLILAHAFSKTDLIKRS